MRYLCATRHPLVPMLYLGATRQPMIIIARLLPSEPWPFDRYQVYSVEGADNVI
jgi:hypothetical protein